MSDRLPRAAVVGMRSRLNREDVTGFLIGAGITLMTLGGYVASSPYVHAPLSKLAAVFIALASGIAMVVHRWVSGMGWIAALWGAFLLPMLVHSPAGDYGLDKVEVLFTASLLAAVAPVLLFRPVRRVEGWAAALMFFAAAISALAVLHPDNPGRLSLEGTNYIGSGRIINLSLALSIACLVVVRRRRWLVLPVVLATAYLGLRTGSRGPLLAALMGGAVLALARREQLRRSITRRTAVLGVAMLAAVVAASSGYAVSRFMGLATGDSSVSDRISLYRAAVGAGLHHPLGLGWGNLADVLSEKGLSLYQYPHNLVLEVFAEAGWVATVLLLVVLSAAFRRAWRQADRTPGAFLLTVLFYFTVNAMVSSDVNVNRVVFTAAFACWCLPNPPPNRLVSMVGESLRSRWAAARSIVEGERGGSAPETSPGAHRKT